MYVVNAHATVALCLAVLLAVAIAAFQWQKSTVIKRRVHRMMLTFGIDEEIARNADATFDMKAVWRICRRCPAPQTCARWLNGEAVPGRNFCPNAPAFLAVAQARQCRVRYEPGHRPGRRLDG